MASSAQADGQVRCKQPKVDGSPCKGRVLPSGYCRFHDPALAEQRSEERRKGGRQRSRPRAVLPAHADDMPLKDVAGLTALLGATINDVRKGRIDAKIANAIGALANVLLRALEAGDLAAQLAELREQIQQGKQNEHSDTEKRTTETANAGSEPGA
jgi:hypothetical protein